MVDDHRAAGQGQRALPEMKALFKGVRAFSHQAVKDQQHALLLQKYQLAFGEQPLVKIAKMRTADKVRRVGKAVLALDRHGQCTVAPTIQTGAEIEAVHSGSIVRGGAF